MLKLLILSLLVLSPRAFADLVVVVSKDSEISALDEDTIENIFLSRTNRYPNGSRATPVELKNNEQRKEFYLKLTGKSPKQLSAYWTSLIFSGKGKPPIKLNSLANIVEQVSENMETITYMDTSMLTNDFKVVYRFE